MSRRSSKRVSYYEETVDDSEESAFEVSEDESPKTKKPRATKAAGTKDKRPMPRASGRKRAVDSDDQNDDTAESDGAAESSDANDDAKGNDAAEDGDASDDAKANGQDDEKECIMVGDSEPGGRASSSAGSVLSGTGTGRGGQGSSKRAGQSPSESDSESDAYQDTASSAAESDGESEFSACEVVVDVGTKRGRGGAKAAATPGRPPAKAAKAKAAAPAKKAKVAPAPKKATGSNASAGSRKPVALAAQKGAKLGSLLSSPKADTPRPRLPGPRPTLSPASSSSSVSTLGSPTRSPRTIRRKSGGASLKDLLKGSSVPRAGLMRRAPAKKAI
ncbi:hypothetical protein GGF46_004053 [Coemansia sp. RSA 552]|nr:hypothetical protein GGF46_004053 [Coemansia sp. RSA 552]